MDKRGLYQKYIVRKVSGPADLDAEYRVLRIDSDPAAEAAWRYYGHLIQDSNPALAADIIQEVRPGAILKPNWVFPDHPPDLCEHCNEPIDVPMAVNTCDGWYLCWECRGGCGHDEYPMVGVWPFVENWESGHDFDAIGFEVY